MLTATAWLVCVTGPLGLLVLMAGVLGAHTPGHTPPQRTDKKPQRGRLAPRRHVG